jgi:hypothetical protein
MAGGGTGEGTIWLQREKKWNNNRTPQEWQGQKKTP